MQRSHRSGCLDGSNCILKRAMFRPARLNRINVGQLVLFRRFLREDPGATYDLKTAFDVDPERDGELAAKRGFVNPQHFVKRTRQEIKQIRKIKNRKFQENGELVGLRIINMNVPRVGLFIVVSNGLLQAFC